MHCKDALHLSPSARCTTCPPTTTMEDIDSFTSFPLVPSYSSHSSGSSSSSNSVIFSPDLQSSQRSGVSKQSSFSQNVLGPSGIPPWGCQGPQIRNDVFYDMSGSNRTSWSSSSHLGTGSGCTNEDHQKLLAAYKKLERELIFTQGQLQASRQVWHITFY